MRPTLHSIVSRCAGIITLAAAALSAHASTVAYYRFEEGAAGSPASSSTGAILDSSGNGYNATAFNGPTYSSSVPATTVPQTGQLNAKSLSFNGINQRLFINDYPALHLTKSMTLEASVFVQPFVGGVTDGNILFRGDDFASYDPWRLTVGLNNAGSTSVGFQVTQTDIIHGEIMDSIAMTIPNNSWISIAATLDDATGVMSLYLNGQLKTSKTTTVRPYDQLDGNQSPGIGIGALQSGGTGQGSENFHGLIDEVRISNTALAPAQFLTVPEPTSLLLLTPALLALTHRRRPTAHA